MGKLTINVGGIPTTAGFDDVADDLGAITTSARNGVDLAPSMLAQIRRRLQALRMGVQQGATVPPVLLQLATNNVSLADAVAKSLTARRATKRADLIDRPSVNIGIPFDNITTAALSPTVTVNAPNNGQPWRFIALEAHTGTTGIRLSTFTVAGLPMIAPTPPTYSANTPANIGPDLNSMNDRKVSRNATIVQPWGFDLSGLLASNATITLQTYNATLAQQTYSISFYAQSFPCGDQAQLRPEFIHAPGSADSLAFGARLSARQRAFEMFG